jgi:hypothetical protein
MLRATLLLSNHIGLGVVPGNNRPGPRIGERAWVYPVSKNYDRPPFRPGTIYGIEFEGGDSIEVHEGDLELIERADSIKDVPENQF